SLPGATDVTVAGPHRMATRLAAIGGESRRDQCRSVAALIGTATGQDEGAIAAAGVRSESTQSGSGELANQCARATVDRDPRIGRIEGDDGITAAGTDTGEIAELTRAGAASSGGTHLL